MKHKIFLMILMIFTFAGLGIGQELRADNTAKYNGGGRYDWTVYIVASTDDLRKIRYVQYTLHPTFKDPVRRVSAAGGQYPFSLSLNGWDEFTIGVKVLFKDGRAQAFTHKLKLFNRSMKAKSRAVY